MKKLYGLIGYPLGHSFSYKYHNERFARLGIDAEYKNYELLDVSMLRTLVEKTPLLCGLNVTKPYKESVMPLLDNIDHTASLVGAVNVISIERDGNNVRMVGYNSDCDGFRTMVSPLLRTHHRKALVLGTGGAAKAVAAALRMERLDVTFVSRHSVGDNIIGYNDLTSSVIEEHTVIVNATPLGMYPHIDTCAPIPYELLTSQHLCCDVVYNPAKTEFMRRAACYGAKVCNGIEMLYKQADIAWEIWNR